MPSGWRSDTPTSSLRPRPCLTRALSRKPWRRSARSASCSLATAPAVIRSSRWRRSVGPGSPPSRKSSSSGATSKGSSAMRSEDARSWSGPLIDAHVHLGQSLFGLEQSLDDLLASMAENGVVQSVVVPLKPRGYHLGPENDGIASAVQTHPDRLRGFARVDPWQGADALRELRRGLDDLRLVGLYLHPFEEQFAANDEIVFPLLAELRERGLPLLLAGGYPGFSHPSQI